MVCTPGAVAQDDDLASAVPQPDLTRLCQDNYSQDGQNVTTNAEPQFATSEVNRACSIGIVCLTAASDLD